MDGLQGLENGPVANASFIESQKNMRLILAGKDAVAVDAIEGLIMSHDPRKSNHLVLLHNDGFGMVDAARIEVIGVQVPNLRRDFELPKVCDGQESKFTRFVANNYTVESLIDNDTLYLTVTNPADLARMTIQVDNQPLQKYVIGGFDDIRLSLQNIAISDGSLDIVFEDIYLNKLENEFQAQLTSIKDFVTTSSLEIFPNPAGKFIYVTYPFQDANGIHVEIIDAAGRICYSENINIFSGGPIRICTENLEEGFYNMVVTDESGVRYASPFIK